VYDCLQDLSPLPPAALARLADLLEPLVSASLLAPEPPRKALLPLSHELAFNAPSHALVRIDQSLADLAAYRDDSHLAAWQSHMVSGQAWDTFTALWHGTVGTVDAVFAQLARRGWPQDAYARALQELVVRGWVNGPEPYTISTQGRVLRDRAEAQTNTYFFAPWHVLDSDERKELRGLLTRLAEALQTA
jgi:hypothetical protein